MFNEYKETKSGEMAINAADFQTGLVLACNNFLNTNDPVPDNLKFLNGFAEKMSKNQIFIKQFKGNSILQQLGGSTFKVYQPFKSGVSKTDIYDKKTNNRYSVKKEGRSQLTSGLKAEALGIFDVALKCYLEKQAGQQKIKQIGQEMIDKIQKTFKNFSGAQVTKTIDNIQEQYIEYRIQELKKMNIQVGQENPFLKKKSDPYQMHVKYELSLINISNKVNMKKQYSLPGLQVTYKDVKNNFLNWLNQHYLGKKGGDEKFKKTLVEFVTNKIDQMKLQDEINQLFESIEFKKWAIYQAATGNYKFSGNINLTNTKKPIANKFLIFSQDGNKCKIQQIDLDWCEKNSDKVKVSVSWKSSGNNTSTSLRALINRLIKENKNLKLQDVNIYDCIDLLIQKQMVKLKKQVQLLLKEENILQQKTFFDLLNIDNIKDNLSFWDMIKNIIVDIFKAIGRFIVELMRQLLEKQVQWFLRFLSLDSDNCGVEIGTINI